MTMKTRTTPASPKQFIAEAERQRVRPDEKLLLYLNHRERELILQHTFADDSLTRRLRIVPRAGESVAYRFTLNELDELAGYVAAEANHAKDKKLKKQLARIFDRIWTLLKAYTDEDH
jgi:hypothetical protein